MSVGIIRTMPTKDVVPTAVAAGRKIAQRGQESAHRFISDPANRAEVECALRIRAEENALYDLFGRGKLHGTIHTRIGQESSGDVHRMNEIEIARDDIGRPIHARCSFLNDVEN